MWRRTVLILNLLAVINRTSTQSANNGTEVQAPMQCCPCPPVAEPGAALDSALQAPPGAAGPGTPESRAASTAAAPDDCPCRPRNADSEGTSSLFFSNAVRAVGTVVRSDPSEDAKPLLQPEVDLASSVLETLRQATDEEFKDALERDAARSTASDDEDQDVTPEEARNVVTIIVSPQDMADDATSEASHVQATRCIDSLLGNPRASFNRPPAYQKGLEEILNLPLPSGLLHRHRDNNLAASNVHENVVKADSNLNRVLSGLRLRTDPGLLNLDPHKIGEDINKILIGQKVVSNDDSRRKSAQPTAAVKDSMTNFDDDDDVSNMETHNVDKQSVTNEDAIGIDQSYLDTDPSPSNVHGIFSEATENEDANLQNEESFLKPKTPLLTKNVKALSQTLFPLRNLLKLKDVELVPLDLNRKILKPKVNIPSMKIEPLQTNKARENGFNQVKLPKLSDFFSEPSKITIEKGTSQKVTNEEMDKENIEKSANIQTIPRKILVKAKILDAIPSTSEIKQVRLNKDKCLSSKATVENLADIDARGDTISIDNLNTAPDAEQLIETIPKEEDNLNIFEIGDIQSFESKSSQNTDNNQLDATENFDILDEDQDLDSVEEIIISEEENEDDIDPASIDFSELDKIDDRSNHTLKNLETIRKNVVEKLNALQINNRKALDNIKQSVEGIAENGDFAEERMEDSEIIESLSPSNIIKDDFKEVGTPKGEVTFQDLQNMSDSILSASEKREKAVPSKDIKLEKHNNRDSQTIGSPGDDFESEEISEKAIDSVLGINEDMQTQSKVRNLEAETNSVNVNDFDAKTDFDDEEKNNLCLSSDLIGKSAKTTETKSSEVNGNIANDLTTLASEPVINSIVRPNSKSLIEHLGDIESKLRQNIIVQPASLMNTDNLNIFGAPMLSIPDISELNTNIPTLDEIRIRVSEILGGLASTAGDEEISSDFDSEDFASNNNPIISTAPLSSLKPLEDINLDIIQLKPLPLLPRLHTLKSEFPGLNLNTYKAKVSVPKFLDLKPLKLASTMGNDGGLVGATLSVGPERKVKTGKSKLKPKAKSNYVSSARNSPTLAEITTSIQNNARNLLNIPETGGGQTLQASNVVENIAENIKSHTENTMRNIHQTLYPSRLDLRKAANDLLNSGRSKLGALHTAASNNNVIDCLRAQTENTLKHVHQTLNSPKISDSVLKSPLHTTSKILRNKLQSGGSIDAALDSLKAQSENTYRSIQQTLSTSPLEDLSKSIHKTTKHIVMSSPGFTSGNNILRATQQTIPQISGIVDNLRSQTDSTLKNIQQTLSTPVFSGTSMQKSAHQMLKSPIKNTNVEVLRNSLPLDNVVDNLKSHTQNTMKNIQNSLSTPTLGDLSAIVPTHAQNILTSPIATAGRDAFEQMLQASPPLIDFKPHAEKAVKDLQKTLKATLRNSPIKDLQPLANPSQVLQMISDHHEDVNDKLFAIQTDLADRLESMHNDVMDPERLRSILSPPINQHFELFAIPLPKGRISTANMMKQTRPTLKSKQPSFDSQKKESKKSIVPKAYKSKSEATKLGEMRTTTGKDKERGLSKSLKLPASASAPIPTKIKKPIQPLLPKKSIFLKPLHSYLLNDPLPPGPEPRKTYQSTTTRRPFIPKLKPETKVTTRRPILSPVSKRPPFLPTPTTARPKVSNNDRFKPKPLVRQPTPWSPARSAFNPIRIHDPLTSPSRVAPVAQPPKSNSVMPAGSNTKIGTLPRLSPLLSRHNSQLLVKPKSKHEISTIGQGRSNNLDSKSLSSSNKQPISLLNKLTDALKRKQTKANLGSPLGVTSQRSEMAPAASESLGSVAAIENPMKENIAYKCKMTCVKLD